MTTRSDIMRAVRSKNTKPERILRKRLHAIAPGYRLNRRNIPGSPDIAYVGRRIAIFMHGCFWHGHECKRGARVPKEHRPYWVAKIARNRARDAASTAGLEAMGWRPVTIWECELKDEAALKARLEAVLAP